MLMMQKQSSPPKHRHDGTSPLPLGMDWSPRPMKWAQLLAEDDENDVASASKAHNINGGDLRSLDDEIRKMLAGIFIHNARLRKQVNSVIRCALKTSIASEEEEKVETPSRKTVLNKFLER